MERQMACFRLPTKTNQLLTKLARKRGVSRTALVASMTHALHQEDREETRRIREDKANRTA